MKQLTIHQHSKLQVTYTGWWLHVVKKHITFQLDRKSLHSLALQRDQILNLLTLTKKGEFLCWPMQKRGLECHCPWWHCWGWRRTFPEKLFLESGEIEVHRSATAWNRAQKCHYTSTCRVHDISDRSIYCCGSKLVKTVRFETPNFFTATFWLLSYRFPKFQ